MTDVPGSHPLSDLKNASTINRAGLSGPATMHGLVGAEWMQRYSADNLYSPNKPLPKTGRAPHPLTEPMFLKGVLPRIPNKDLTNLDFAQLPGIRRTLEDMPEVELTLVINLWKMSARILQTGPIIYRTSTNLERVLIDTNLLNMTVDYLVPPHEAFLVELSEQCPLTVFHAGEHYQLAYMMFYREQMCEQIGPGEALKVMFTGHPIATSRHDFDNANSFCVFPFGTGEGKKIKEWIKNECASMELLHEHITPEVSRNMNDLYSFAAKLILYIVCENCDVTEEAARIKTLQDRIKRLDAGTKAQKKKAQRLLLDLATLPTEAEYGRKVLGSRISYVNRQRELNAGEPGEGTHESPGKHWVGAHWKLQPHGEGRKLRKIIHVEEYERGNDAVELINKRIIKVK